MKSLQFIRHFAMRLFLATAFLLPLFAGFTSPVAAKEDDPSRAVYTMTNAASGNEVVVYDRSGNGDLSFQGSYPTDGLGSGAGLGSQGAVILSENGHWLFAVNAGSNNISVFRIKQNGLDLVDVADSGGIQPISLTIHGKLLYALNAGDASNPGNVTGFRVRDNGKLRPLNGSTQPLSNDGPGASIGPAQVSFDNRGKFLVVTEKMMNLIDTYQLKNGIAAPPETNPSAGETPFGFAFDQQNHPIVSEAFGGAPDVSALSSYESDKGTLQAISASIPTTQTAACWVVISNNGKYAYTTNAGSGSISSYRIGKDGSLTLLEAQAGLTGDGSSPIDMAISNNGRYLYALGGASHTISIFQVKADGSLVSRGGIDVPAGSVGLAAQ